MLPANGQGVYNWWLKKAESEKDKANPLKDQVNHLGVRLDAAEARLAAVRKKHQGWPRFI